MEKNESNNVVSITQAKKLNPVNTRERIIDAYIELITKQGFAATTHKQLAEKAKVSSSTIYYHFAKKTDLYETLFHHIDEKYLALFDNEDLFTGKLEARVTLFISLVWQYTQSPLYWIMMEIRLVIRNDQMMARTLNHPESFLKKRNQRFTLILAGSKVSDRKVREAVTYANISLIGLSYETVRNPKLANIGGYLRRISRNMVKMLKSPD